MGYYLNNTANNGNGSHSLSSYDLEIAARFEAVPTPASASKKISNPLLAPYLGTDATEAQLAYLLAKSQEDAEWAVNIAMRIRAPLSFRDAKMLVEWAEPHSSATLARNQEWGLPPLNPKSDWWPWIMTVRKSLGQPEFSTAEKVENRMDRFFGKLYHVMTLGNRFHYLRKTERPVVPPAIPLEESEKGQIRLLTLLAITLAFSFWVVFGLFIWCITPIIVFGVAMLLFAPILIGQNIIGWFRDTFFK